MMNNRNPQIRAYAGNHSLLDLPKTAFLCSRQVPAETVLKCYDWAIQMRKAGHCVISGFHSPLEQDVLHYLLKGNQPVIMALARGMKTIWEPRIQKALEDDRLLIVSPFDAHTKRTSAETAAVRNDLMLQLADEIVVGYADPTGMLRKQLDLALMGHPLSADGPREKKLVFLTETNAPSQSPESRWSV